MVAAVVEILTFCCFGFYYCEAEAADDCWSWVKPLPARQLERLNIVCCAAVADPFESFAGPL